MQINHQYPYGFCSLARITALREKKSLNAAEFAQLSGLEEFPNNGTMADCAISEIQERLGVNSSRCLTPEERETLKAVRLTRKIYSNSNGMLLCERGKIARFNRMINADMVSFLEDLDIILTYKPINLLLYDELFKDMLYQRYQELGWNHIAITLRMNNNELSNMTKEEVLNLFRVGEEHLHRKRGLLASGELSLPIFNEGIPRRESYPDRWAGEKNINTKNDDICHCSHGGGFRYLQRILRGLHPGSELEHQTARGIQVHPHSYPWDKLNFYAKRSLSYFDTPAIITFDIKAEYLDGQPNGYEAGIRHEFFDQASKFKLENTTTGEVIEATDLVKMREEILKRKAGIGDL
jgi:hypothetical protein